MRAPVAAQIFQNDATGAFNQAPILNISLTRTHIDTNKTCIDSVEKKNVICILNMYGKACYYSQSSSSTTGLGGVAILLAPVTAGTGTVEPP